MNKNFLITFVFLLFTEYFAIAQIKVGDWRNHVSFNEITSLTVAGDEIICSAGLSLFSYNIKEGTYDKLSKIDGLSESVIRVINFHEQTKSLIIAYENSNIDIIRDDKVIKISDIQRKQLSGDKRINKIKFRNEFVYFACGFGIVVFDLQKMEFKDTYFIGQNAAFINVYDLTFSSDSIYAATERGIFSANLNSTKLADYSEWNFDTSNETKLYQINTICYSNNIIYAGRIDTDTGERMSLRYINNKWEEFKNEEFKSLVSIENIGDKTVFTDKNTVRIIDDSGNTLKQVSWYVFGDISTWVSANYATLDEAGNLLIADSRFGLVILHQNDVLAKYSPAGTENNFVGRIHNAGNKIYLTAGAKGNSAWHKGQFSVFDNEKWTSTYTDIDNVLDYYAITNFPGQTDRVYIGTWGYGLFEYKNSELLNTFDDFNSTLDANEQGLINISSCKFDDEKNLWVANSEVANPISVMTADNNWYSYNFDGELTGEDTDDLIITKSGNIWLELGIGKGLFAFNPNQTPETDFDDDFSKFIPIDSDGNQISANIYSIAEDRNGEIWVGTDEGPVIYYSPESVFDKSGFYANRVQLTAFGNDTTEQYLLETETITAIAVDGANRKWLGTQNSGVFLVSEDGKVEILSFNITNSPIFSNTIIDIGINQKTGEVFIGTDKGLLSYRAEASSPLEFFSELNAFPNPVRPGYTGLITVTGLMENSIVKFVDASGSIVYETESFGGQAIWKGVDFSGKKVASGVYFIFASDKNGENYSVGKILFMN